MTSLVRTGSSLKMIVIEARGGIHFFFSHVLVQVGLIWTGACAISRSSIVKWLPGTGGGPTPPGLPAMVVDTFLYLMLRAGVSVASSGESSGDERFSGLYPFFF